MSLEFYEEQVSGMLPVEENYFTAVHNHLNHCSKHGSHLEIQSVGMGQLTSEWAPAFRLVFNTPQNAATFDANHKAPTEAPATVHHPESKPTINVGQPRMMYILANQCGLTGPEAGMLISKAAKQYNAIKQQRR